MLKNQNQVFSTFISGRKTVSKLFSSKVHLLIHSYVYFSVYFLAEKSRAVNFFIKVDYKFFSFFGPHPWLRALFEKIYFSKNSKKLIELWKNFEIFLQKSQKNLNFCQNFDFFLFFVKKCQKCQKCKNWTVFDEFFHGFWMSFRVSPYLGYRDERFFCEKSSKTPKKPDFWRFYPPFFNFFKVRLGPESNFSGPELWPTLDF